MGRPRGFDEAEVIRAAVRLFASRPYDAISVDDLVTHVGVHRNSLYKTFGSKRGLYVAALRQALHHDLAPLIADLGALTDRTGALRHAFSTATGGTALDMLLLAAVERAPADPEVAQEVAGALAGLDRAVGRMLDTNLSDGTDAPSGLAVALTATLLGLRLRARAGAADTDIDRAGATLADRLDHHC